MLVTGGTGTIGAEIVKQVLRQQPRVVRVFSRDESKQAHLRHELPADGPLRYLIGDVRDRNRLRVALEGYATATLPQDLPPALRAPLQAGLGMESAE